MKIAPPTTTSPAPLSPVRVDVRLCGSIPRSVMADQFGRGAPCPLSDLTSSDLNASHLAVANGSSSDCSTLKPSLYHGLAGLIAQNPSMAAARIQSSTSGATDLNGSGSFQQFGAAVFSAAPLYEPPSWAVPARGEARLEPVCEALGRQTSVDLTSKSSFRVGRSPLSDVQLHHGTSSRRHALLFHHSNGSCYIVDCGSAHGTYVNGVRITSPPKGGVVIPHKVRRGAMIRFGGPGAPCFVLKSFSFNLEELADAETTSSATTEVNVEKNTRLNALGQTAIDSVRLSVLNMTSKRSFDSLDGAETFDEQLQEPCLKRMRCSSPPLSPQEPLPRLVSPSTPPAKHHRRVSFSTCAPQTFYPAAVTPEELSSDEDGC